MSEARTFERPASLQVHQPYPAYKNSGSEWIGEIPTHWLPSKVKYIGRYINGYAFKPDDWGPEGLAIIRIQNLTDSDAPTNFYDKILPRHLLVERGDLLISWSASLGLHVWDGDDAWLNQHIFKVAVNERLVTPSYFVWLAKWFMSEMEKDAHGSTMQHVTKDKFGGFQVFLPGVPEQSSIAAFLERETTKIDALVARKERLIELLQEKRTALITSAVTKGLDPNVPMKDSGVEWLGQIPAHWEVKRLRHLGEAIIGLTYEPEDVVGPDNEGVLVLRASNVSDGHIVLEDNVFVRCSIPDRLRTKVADILICSRSGSRALIGKSAKIDGAAVGLTFGTFMTMFRSVYNAYLFYVFNSTLFHYQTGSFLTSTINQLTVSNLKSLTVPVPPDGEQSAIAGFLDRATARIDALVAKVRDGIERLKEYRTALISAAVTGKIDVREKAA